MRHLTVIAFLLLVVCHIEMVSQSCLPDGITFTTQSQIDSFQINHPNCTEIEGSVNIEGDDIVNLYGLSAITSVGESLGINNNDLLTNLTGLDNLTSINGNLTINTNWLLTDITSLSNLSSINGDVRIESNYALTSLTGLETLNGNSIENLTITFNYSLSNCNVMSICSYLTSPNGRVRIAYNDIGCSTPSEIANDCGITLPCLPYGEYTLYKQNQIDSFATNYPDCFDLQDYVRIRGDVTNLYGLSEVRTIGHLHIEYTDSLTGLSGLGNLERIEYTFHIWENQLLIDLTGLLGLDSLGGGIWIRSNYALTSLTGLDSLVSLGSLWIDENYNLEGLDGIDNVEPGSIGNLTITGNPWLSKCNVQSICEYLVAPNGTVTIYDNDLGCNSQQEVEEACTVGVSETPEGGEIFVYPNPFTTSTTIEYELTKPSHVQLTIYNYLGGAIQKAVSALQSEGSHIFHWSPKQMSAGVYYAVLRSKEGVSVMKMIKQ